MDNKISKEIREQAYNSNASLNKMDRMVICNIEIVIIKTGISKMVGRRMVRHKVAFNKMVISRMDTNKTVMIRMATSKTDFKMASRSKSSALR